MGTILDEGILWNTVGEESMSDDSTYRTGVFGPAQDLLTAVAIGLGAAVILSEGMHFIVFNFLMPE